MKPFYLLLALFPILLSADVLSIPPLTPSQARAISNSLVPWRESVVAIGKATFTGGANLASGAYSYRARYVASVPFREFYLNYAGWITANGSFLTNNIALSLKAAIQLADSSGAPSGQVYQVTFNGGSLTGTNGFGDYMLKSDPIPIPMTAGQIFFVQTYTTSASAAYNSFVGNDSGESFYGNDGTSYLQPTWDSSQSGTVSIAPSAITAFVHPTNQVGVLLYGDSIAQLYNGDQTYITNGWLQRALVSYPSGSYNYIPVVNCGIGSSSIIGQTNSVNYFQALYPLSKGWVRSVVFEGGFNDFFSLGYTAANVEFAARWHWAYMRSIGASNIIACTVKPATTSTDGWLTVANQSPRSGDGERLLYNAWLRTQVGISGGVDAVFDLATALASSTNSSRLATGPLTIILSDTAGASTSTSTIRTSGSGFGSIACAGGVIALTHLGTTYYGQVRFFRAGPQNLLFLANPLPAASSGDMFTIYNSWCGDSAGSGAHPSGYGMAQIASQWNSNLTAILVR
jgi:hypothetical protein